MILGFECKAIILLELQLIWHDYRNPSIVGELHYYACAVSRHSYNDFMSLTLTFLCISSAGKVEVCSARDCSFNPV